MIRRAVSACRSEVRAAITRIRQDAYRAKLKHAGDNARSAAHKAARLGNYADASELLIWAQRLGGETERRNR